MSRFPVIRHLTSMTAKAVAEHLKAIFSEFGVPDVLISDNGPCYTGELAMRKLNITHVTTSPNHHQSNGLAEVYVRIVKNLLSKAKETGEDYHEVIPYIVTYPSMESFLHHLSSYITENQIQTFQNGRKEVLYQQKTFAPPVRMHRQQRTMYCQLGHT